MGKKLSDFGNAHVFGMTFVVKEDEVFYPLQVRVFGARGVVFYAKGIAKLVEEFFIFWS